MGIISIIGAPGVGKSFLVKQLSTLECAPAFFEGEEGTIPQEILDSPKLGFTTEETKVNKLFKSAEDSIKGDLSSTVLLLFNVSEILLREKLESINIDTSKKSVTEIFSLAAKNKLLLKGELVQLDKLRMFRNKVVHQEFIPTSKECQDMLVFVRALIKRLK
mgnify:CR=1 FL=1